MSWLICGTVPNENFPLTEGHCEVAGDILHVGNTGIRISRGTPALAATASLAADVLGAERPRALLCGDTGNGSGSRKLYKYLVDHSEKLSEYSGITFHYLLPDVDWHNKVMFAIDELDKKPVLVADAGYMYVAKMSGFASSYDLFTPDAGEMAFLADEKAPHPFYTRGFLLQEDNLVPDLIKKAYEYENAARYLIVKGSTDWIVSDGKIMETVSEPNIESMEPIGGTGDSLTGFVTAFLSAGYPMIASCSMAARANRFMGYFANPSPAFSISQLLSFLPEAIHSVLKT